MSDWFLAETSMQNWIACGVALVLWTMLAFCMWALDEAGKRYREASAFYQAYLDDVGFEDEDEAPPSIIMEEKRTGE